MRQLQFKIQTPLGPLFLVASACGLKGIYLTRQDIELKKILNDQILEEKILIQAEKQIEEYFQGTRKSFALPLELQGTPFQKRVWQELQKIPYGQTVSYKQIAQRIQNPNAVRAVGSANGKNPLCIIVPCHRVISYNGKLGGYSGGLTMKRALLTLEKQTLQ